MDTTVLRVLAIVLIANSHLEDFYPFRPLAADGLIGNPGSLTVAAPRMPAPRAGPPG